MLCNSSVTVYHYSGLNLTTHFEEWTRYNYENAWFFEKQGSAKNKGYDNSNSFECRIPYDKNENLNFENFSDGDIIVKGTLNQDIETQQDLQGYTVYNITGRTNNTYGNNRHIHLSGE